MQFLNPYPKLFPTISLKFHSFSSRIDPDTLFPTISLKFHSFSSRIDPDTEKAIKIYPLPHMYVVKDLVPDMTHFFEQYASVQPWLQQDEEIKYGEKQIYQSVDDRKKLDGLWVLKS